MKMDDQFESTLPKHFINSNQMVAVYTVLILLRKMKGELGLEAMLEYMNAYLEVIEKYNPKLGRVVSKAVSLMSMEKMYARAVSKNENVS